MNETISILNKKNKQFLEKYDEGIGDAAEHVKNEVQESIRGNRGEPFKSVDTGAFLRSVKAEKIADLSHIIYSDINNPPYPKFLEYGTSKIKERRHFRNTAARESPTIKKFLTRKNL